MEPPDEPSVRPSRLVWVAAALAIGAVAGSLYLSIGMALRACPLCQHQRSFAMGAAAVLVVGALSRELRSGMISLLALPMAIAGVALAAMLVYYESQRAIECPLGVFGLGTAPQQGLVLLGSLALVLNFDLLLSGRTLGMMSASLLGAALAYGSVAGTPVSPAPDYAKPIDADGCRAVRPIPEPEKRERAPEVDRKTGMPFPLKGEKDDD